MWERVFMDVWPHLGAWPHPTFGSMAAYMGPVRTWEHGRIGTWSSLRTSCRVYPDILLRWPYSKSFHHYHVDGDVRREIFVCDIFRIWERGCMGARLGAWPHPTFGSMAAYMGPVRTWEHGRIGTWSSLRASCCGLLNFSTILILLSLSRRWWFRKGKSVLVVF